MYFVNIYSYFITKYDSKEMIGKEGMGADCW